MPPTATCAHHSQGFRRSDASLDSVLSGTFAGTSVPQLRWYLRDRVIGATAGSEIIYQKSDCLLTDERGCRVTSDEVLPSFGRPTALYDADQIMAIRAFIDDCIPAWTRWEVLN